MGGTDERARAFGIIALVLVVLVISFLVVNHSSQSAPSVSSLSGSAPAVLPPLESRFIEIVSTAQGDSRRTENDMQKGGVKARRDKSICSTLSSYSVADWVGTVEEIDSNSDGKGVLGIRIAPDVIVKTWNNDLSDIGSDTLIEPGSPVFESAAAMKSGQLVRFSGTFLPGSSGDCLNEGSITLNGKVESPEFIFRFTKVSAYGLPQRPVQTLQEPSPAPLQESNPSAHSSEVSRGPQPAPAEDSSPAEAPPAPAAKARYPAQGGGAAEIDRQAVDFRNQKQYSEAELLLSRACDQGEADACHSLGLMFDLGRGVAENSSRARELYLKACRAGSEKGCNDLNILLSYEPDLVQCTSPEASVTLSRTTDACNSGNGASCATLGHLFTYGCGTSKDLEKARQAYAKACTAGNQQGCDRLKEMQ